MMSNIKELLIGKGFAEVADGGYMKVIYRKEDLERYFELDPELLKKVQKGDIPQIELFVYPDEQYADWWVDSNDVATPDYYEGVIEFIKDLPDEE